MYDLQGRILFLSRNRSSHLSNKGTSQKNNQRNCEITFFDKNQNYSACIWIFFIINFPLRISWNQSIGERVGWPSQVLIMPVGHCALSARETGAFGNIMLRRHFASSSISFLAIFRCSLAHLPWGNSLCLSCKMRKKADMPNFDQRACKARVVYPCTVGLQRNSSVAS